MQQRTLDEEPGAEDLVGRVFAQLSSLLEQAGVEELTRVIPLVQRLVGVDALVALEAHELGAERGCQCLGDLGLADAGLALEEERLTERERQEDGGSEAAVGEIRLLAEARRQLLDGVGAGRLIGGLGAHGISLAHRAATPV